MAAPFIPSKGDYFYCAVTPRRISTIVRKPFEESTVVDRVITDNSHKSCVFECLGRDDHAVVAVRVHGGGYCGDRKELFQNYDYTYTPVGPEVVQALGICRTSSTTKEH